MKIYLWAILSFFLILPISHGGLDSKLNLDVDLNGEIYRKKSEVPVVTLFHLLRELKEEDVKKLPSIRIKGPVPKIAPGLAKGDLDINLVQFQFNNNYLKVLTNEGVVNLEDNLGKKFKINVKNILGHCNFPYLNFIYMNQEETSLNCLNNIKVRGGEIRIQEKGSEKFLIKRPSIRIYGLGEGSSRKEIKAEIESAVVKMGDQETEVLNAEFICGKEEKTMFYDFPVLINNCLERARAEVKEIKAKVIGIGQSVRNFVLRVDRGHFVGTLEIQGILGLIQRSIPLEGKIQFNEKKYQMEIDLKKISVFGLNLRSLALSIAKMVIPTEEQIRIEGGLLIIPFAK